MTVTLLHGDCLEILPTLPDKSIDAIITDLPYGTTACKWDVIIPLDEMWKQVKRVLKDRGAFVTTASQPFTSVLVCSNLEWFKYCWYWKKTAPVGFLNANYRPLTIIEDVVVFSAVSAGAGAKGKATMNFFPQGLRRVDWEQRNRPNGRGFNVVANTTPNNSINSDRSYIQEYTGYPNNILEYKHDSGLHPTQKPVALYEYLIRTYTNEGDTVLDFTAGSGTTGAAAIKTNRNAILIEKDPEYFAIMERRIKEAQMQMVMPL